MRAALDQAHALGHALGLYLHPLNSARFGTPGSADPGDAAVRAHAMATLAGWLDPLADHPGLKHLLLNSEYAARWHGPAMQLTAAMARAARERRPGLLVWTDPWRDQVVRVPPGVDALGSWTYGHPHPLRQWIVPFLRAGAGPGRQVMQTVSLWLAARWTAAAEEAGDWRLTPPGPAAIALWLAFAQAPDILSVYAPSPVDPFAAPPPDPRRFPPETWQAQARIAREVVIPFGPVLRACRPAPAKVALLLSAASVPAVGSPTRPPGWDGEVAWPLAAMLVMQGFPFEVLLDEDFAAPLPPRFETVLAAFGARPAAARAPGGRALLASEESFGFLRGVDGGLANRVPAAEAHARLARLAEALAARLPPTARMARHDAQLAVGHHAGGAATWHVVVNTALAGASGATYLDRGVARTARLALRAAPGTVFVDALSRRPIPARFADGFAELSLDLPAAGGAVIAALPAAPGRPVLERAPGGALLRAPFAGVLPYDVTLGGATRRLATGADGTRRIAGAGRLAVTCALSGAEAALDI